MVHWPWSSPTGGYAEAIPGLVGTAVFVVTNNGPDDAPHSPMVIDLPAGRVGAPVIDGASCTPSTDPARPDQLICDAGPVRSLANDPNAFQLVTVSFVPPAGQTAPMSVDAYTSPDLTAFYVDKDLKNDVGAVQLRMTPETDMLLTGSAPASLAVGAAGDDRRRRVAAHRGADHRSRRAGRLQRRRVGERAGRRGRPRPNPPPTARPEWAGPRARPWRGHRRAGAEVRRRRIFPDTN